jgi:HPt (histidine-containing phosphotransfer) domain-containing protein
MTGILDMTALNEAKEMMQTKFPTMVQYFIEDSDSYIGLMHDGIATKSAEKIILPAHTLKSSARQMGAVRMCEIATTMEALAREQSANGTCDMAPFVDMLAQLEGAFAQTKEALQPFAAVSSHE